MNRNAMSKIFTNTRNFFASNRVRTVLRVGEQAFGYATPLIDKPTPWNLAKTVFCIAKSIVDSTEVWSDDFFDGTEWTAIYNPDFADLVTRVVKFDNANKIKTCDEGKHVVVGYINGIKCGWTVSEKSAGTYTFIYAENARAEEAKQAIATKLWESFSNNSIVLCYATSMSSQGKKTSMNVVVDDAFHPLPSEKAESYSTYLKTCIERNVPRSVMLYGPPGTGKSTMARTIINNLGLRSMRIRVEDIANLENETIFDAISTFKPDAIILDDFDRTSMQSSLLETLEFFQRHVKLIISTVNNRDNLDEALLRPGRFDELIEINKIDKNVILHVLNEFKDGYDIVKDWPIAFIQEYKKRREFMSAEDAANSVKELAARVHRLKTRYRDDSEKSLVIKSHSTKTRSARPAKEKTEEGLTKSVSNGTNGHASSTDVHD